MRKLLLLGAGLDVRKELQRIAKRLQPSMVLVALTEEGEGQDGASSELPPQAMKEQVGKLLDGEREQGRQAVVVVDWKREEVEVLELIRWIRREYPLALMIVLGGRDAMEREGSCWGERCRAISRNLDEAEFRQVLGELAELEREEQRQQEDRMLAEFGALCAIFMGELEQEDLEHYGMSVGLPEQGVALSIQVRFLYERGGRKKIANRVQLYRELKVLLGGGQAGEGMPPADSASASAGARKAAICPVLANEMLGYVEAREQEEVAGEEIRALAERVASFMERKYRLRVRIGIGTVQPFRYLCRSQREAKRALNQYPEERVVVAGVEPQKWKSGLEDRLSELEEQLCFALRMGKMESLDRMEDFLGQCRELPLQNRQVRLMRLMGYVNYIAQEYTKELQENRINTEALLEMVLGSCWETAENWAYWSFFHILKMVRRGVRDQSFGLISQGEEYLMEVFQRDVSLEDISFTFGISPQYFSRMFKERTGKNYTDWLNHYRIARAKDLIRYTRMSIQEVSTQVGFSDSNYFSRSFKAMEKKSPTDFAKQYRV